MIGKTAGSWWAGPNPIPLLNLTTSDLQIAGDLVARLFEKDFSASEEMTDPISVGLLEKAAEIIANQL